MSQEDEEEFAKEGERAEVQLRRSLRKAKAVVARYRPLIAGRKPGARPEKPLFKFDR